MKVLIKNFDTGFKKIAQVDQDYFKRQSKIIELYRMLVTHYKLIVIRRDLKRSEKIKEERR
jgi:uncharacterized Fe-S cluster-containing radical SAM superfamily protein